MNLRGKYVVVIGAKRSGRAAVELLKRRGAQVRVMQDQVLEPGEQEFFDSIKVRVVPQEEACLMDSERQPDLIVLSPAVPYDLPLLVSARSRGISVIGEVELAAQFLCGPVIGITGSNGKTTTTALTGHLLKSCGIRCQVGGNIGTAVSSMVASSEDEQWNVLELSSFQLESISRFHADIAACLNVTPDHLDRHHTFEAYAQAKGRLFETQRPGDHAVLNFDDPTCRTYAERTKAQVSWFSSSQKVPSGIWLDGEVLRFNDTEVMRRSAIPLRGTHNVENVMAAALMAFFAGAPVPQIGPAISKFPGVEHRIEFVRTLDGVEYYNDSKATNVDATLKAIEAFPGNLWIILGGKDKGSDYAPLRTPLQQKGKGVLLIGAEPPYPYAAAPLIREVLEGAVMLVDCGTLAGAIEYARRHAVAGDFVLLAPACASFDQFQNFEERGRAFKHLVAELV